LAAVRVQPIFSAVLGLGRGFHQTLSSYLRNLPAGPRRFWLLVPLTGVIAGLGAVISVHLLAWVQHFAWHSTAEIPLEAERAASWQRRLLVPCSAGVLVVLVGFLLRRPTKGHGTSQIIEAIWVFKGDLAVRWALVYGLLSLVVVGLGASLGREGALIYFGAASGSFLGRKLGIGGDRRKLLVACGASAGFAAAYNTPIGGALFSLEVFLGGLSLELYGPLIFASVSATVISRALLYEHPSYVIPHYRLNHPSELPLYLLLGVGVGVLSGLFARTVEVSSRWARSVPERPRRFLPIFALAAVGTVGIWRPEVFGNGYDTVNNALAGRLPLALLLTLPVLKLVLSVACASSGTPGALFTPSLYIGGLAGGAFGVAAHHLLPHVVVSPGGYAVVGMAAILAGSTHATLAAPLILFELTGGYDLILPLLTASVVATAVSRLLAEESIYTAPLRRRGVELHRVRPAWMQHEGVRRLVRGEAPWVRPNAPFSDVLVALARLGAGQQLFVVDSHGRLRGGVSFDDVREALADQPELELLVAADLARPAAAISVDASLWDVTRRALSGDSELLPVYSPREGGRFVGTIAVRDVLAAAATDAAPKGRPTRAAARW
jgi:CIC family chloride channel protein